MRILLLSFEYPPETGFGGIGTYTWYQARALAKLGHTVHVLAGAGAATRIRTTEQDGVTVHRFRASGPLMRVFGLFGLRRMFWTQNRLENGWSMFRGFRALVDREGYDVIEMPECGAEGWVLNHLSGANTVVRFHSPARLIMDTYDVSRADVVACGAVEHLAMSGARGFTSCSRFLADEVRTRLGIRKSIEVIANGIDLDLFDREPQIDVRQKFGVPPGRPLVLFTGRMEPRKGIELCPEIVGTILERHAVAFAFAGRDLFGYMKNTLLPQVQARTLRGSIHYLGELDLSTVRSCVRQADVFFLPSLWENCPYSCIEAMAAGRAIVCSDQGGMPELVEHEVSGLLAHSGNAASYVAQLERVLEDAGLRERLGAAARRSVETSLTDVHIAERSVAYYRSRFPAATRM
ncbi:MAG: glycosyltransferase family 4 protein [Acidobacteriota bacterium]